MFTHIPQISTDLNSLSVLSVFSVRDKSIAFMISEAYLVISKPLTFIPEKVTEKGKEFAE